MQIVLFQKKVEYILNTAVTTRRGMFNVKKCQN